MTVKNHNLFVKKQVDDSNKEDVLTVLAEAQMKPKVHSSVDCRTGRLDSLQKKKQNGKTPLFPLYIPHYTSYPLIIGVY